ncbi:MAG: MBL fold metallo-hydrolase [Hyphomicrobiales bacterium]|nr:MAG: MBL fold metallo-hydrolase [Hyphomicrobiales bacterium]
MPRWLRITLIILVLLLVTGGGAYYWLIGDGNPPGTLQAYRLDLEAVRAKAEELPGGKASAIEVETIARFSFPAVAAVGGDGWEGKPLGVFSYQIVLPTDTIVVDTAFPADLVTGIDADIDAAAYARMDQAMADATQIVVTHEHADHIGGIVANDDPARLQKALRLTSEQVASLPSYGLALPTALSDYMPLDYADMIALAPGVVLVRAPGHTPGSQLVYVKREDGRELLFIGDIGWTERNIETGKGRPRLVSQFILNEDRDAVFAELAWLKALHEAEPDLAIVPGHDLEAVDALVASGALRAGFTSQF